MLRLLRSFPLLLFAILLYNAIAFINGFDGAGTEAWLLKSVPLKMFSGQIWNLSLGDSVVLIALTLLFVEVIKATGTAVVEVINHALSMVVFIIALIEFITLQAFATSVFFFITAMALFDIVAGFTISIVAAKRDLGLAGGVIGTN